MWRPERRLPLKVWATAALLCACARAGLGRL